MFFDLKSGVIPKVYRHKRIKEKRYLIHDGLIISLDALRHVSLQISDGRYKDDSGSYVACKQAQVWMYYKHNTLWLEFDRHVEEARALVMMVQKHLLTEFEEEQA